MTEKKDNNQKRKVVSPGIMLLKARQASHLSVEHIAGKLNLSQDIIEALEKDEFNSLPAPIFVRGYIRTYSALVGISDKAVLECYNTMVGSNDPAASLNTIRMSKMKPVSSGFGKKLLPAAMAGMVVVLAVVIWFSMESRPEQADPAQIVANAQEGNTAKPVPLETSGSSPALPVNNVPVPEEAQMSVIEAEVKKPDAPVTETVTAPETPREAATVKPDSGLDQLVLEFADDSWVDVRDSLGNRLIFKMVHSGEKYSVSGKPPFKLTLGNAKKASLSRNGKIVDLTPYLRGNVAKFSLGQVTE